MNIDNLFVIFGKRTGRMDVTKDEFRHLANEACELLASMESFEDSTYRYVYAVPAELTTLPLPERFRSVDGLKVFTDETFVEYTQVPIKALRAHIQSGETLEEFSFLSGIITESGTLPNSSFSQVPLESETSLSKYILLNPPAPAGSFIELESKSFAAMLTATQVSNFWTDRYPWLILQAINYLLVRDLLNPDEAAKVLKGLMEVITLVTHDKVENENICNMEG